MLSNPKNHFTKIGENMSKPPPSGSPGFLIGASLGRMLFKILDLRGGQRGAPLGLPPAPGERGGQPRKSENLWCLTGFFRQQLSETNPGYHKTLPDGDNIITGKLNYEIICLVLKLLRYGRCWDLSATLFYLLA